MALMVFKVYKIENTDKRSKALKTLSPGLAPGHHEQLSLECISDEMSVWL